MVDAVYQHGVKLLISTAGGAGPAAHVDFLKEIITDLINRKKYALKVATIYSDVSKETVLQKLKQGKVHPCGEIEQLKAEDVERSDAIVCQIGHEPFLKSLAEEPDIVIVSSSLSFAILPAPRRDSEPSSLVPGWQSLRPSTVHRLLPPPPGQGLSCHCLAHGEDHGVRWHLRHTQGQGHPRHRQGR
jgi:hypothetical protein